MVWWVLDVSIFNSFLQVMRIAKLDAALDSFIYSSKINLRTHPVPGSMLGTDRAANKPDKIILMKLTLYGGRQAINPLINE